MNRRISKMISIVAVGSLLAAACGGNGGDATDDGPVTLRFVSLAWQEQTVQLNKELIKEWNQAHPDIQVKYVQGDWGAIQDQLLTSFEGGSPPDIFHYEAAALQLFAKSGFLQNLGPLLSEDFKASIPDDIWGTVQYEDYGTIGVPFSLENLTIYANKKMLDSAGITAPTMEDPWTWREFQDAARKLTTEDRFGVAFPIEEDDAVPITMSPAFGGTWVTGTGRDASLKLGDDELAVVRRIHSMLYNARSADPAVIGTGATDALPGFVNGKYAMILDGTFVRQQLVQQAPEGFEWEMLPPPAGDEGQTQAVNPQTLSVAAQSEHPEAAARFLEFFVNPENMARLAQADWLAPASEKAQQIVLEETGGKNGWEVAIDSVKDLTSAPWQPVPGFDQWTYQVAVQAFAQYLGNEISREAMLKKLKQGAAVIGRN